MNRQVECPSCHNTLDIGQTSGSTIASCPSCGSRLSHILETVVQPKHQRILGHFELLDVVGRGQFGEVWRARDLRLGRTVALKLPRLGGLDSHTQTQFSREARATAALTHPNIARLYEVGDEEGQIFIASEFIDGVTLRDRMRVGRMDFSQAARLMQQVAVAVEHAHVKQIVHRDLKPGNILLDREERPYVADFGLAKNLAAEATQTVDGTLIGTPAYMSPEQASGYGSASDPRSDVYSLGVILYELLTAARPYGGDSSMLLYQIRTVDPVRPRALDPSIPRDLEKIAVKAMRKRPEDRYQTAGELAADLERFLDGEPVLARPISRMERSWRKARQHPVATSAVALALAACSVSLWLSAMMASPDATNATLAPVVLHPVQIDTEPAGATLAIWPLDHSFGEVQEDRVIRPDGPSPQSVSLEPGHYLVVAALESGRFHEVYRTVPARLDSLPSLHRHQRWQIDDSGQVRLPTIEIPDTDATADMVLLPGAEGFQVGDAHSTFVPAHRRSIDPFYLDSHEVTVAEYQRSNAGKIPSSVRSKNPPESLPITDIFIDQAVAHAERVGKRLPTEFEYEFAATNGGATRYPWGAEFEHEPKWELQPADGSTFDRCTRWSDVTGLFSNAAEYTLSPAIPYPARNAELPDDLLYDSNRGVIVRGGAVPLTENHLERLEELGPRFRMGIGQRGRHPLLGFRCARSLRPRL